MSPYRISPIHHWHNQRGAQFILWSGWEQVHSYADPGKEANAACSGVGLCDLTPLTKIDIQGQQCDALLSRSLSPGSTPPLGFHAHTHTSGDQKIRVRAVHLARDRYLALGSPEVRESLYEHLLRAASQLECVRVTDITSGLALLRILGPKSVDLLNKLCPVGLTCKDFANERCMQAPIARVNAILLRNDILGTLSFDALISRDYGEYVWKSFVEAGHPFQISWFGLAACRLGGEEEMQRVEVV